MRIQYTDLTATYRVEAPFDLPFFSGSLCRGLLRRGLRAVGCSQPNAESCGEACQGSPDCQAGWLLEPTMPDWRPHPVLLRESACPAPLVPLFPPLGNRPLAQGDLFELGLRVLGNTACHMLPLLQEGLAAATALPIRNTGRIALTEFRVRPGQSLEMSVGVEAEGGVELRTLTALSLRQKRVQLTSPSFLDLFHRAHARFIGLAALYGEVDDHAEEHFQHLRTLAAAPKLSSTKLRNCTWERDPLSGEKHPMEGMVGSWGYDGELGPFLPLLHSATVLNLGARINFGLGRVEMRTRAPQQEG